MKNEEFERHIEFILQRQANFADSLERQAAAHAESIARHDRVDRQIRELVQSMSIFRDALVSLTPTQNATNVKWPIGLNAASKLMPVSTRSFS